MARDLPIGGYRRDPRVPQLGPFIRDALDGGITTWAYQLWHEYQAAVIGVPLRRGKGQRRCITYEGFRRYLHRMRQLNLVEYVPTPSGKIAAAEVIGGAVEKEKLYFRKVSGSDSSHYWNNIWED
jgi:hypothetical protein